MGPRLSKSGSKAMHMQVPSPLWDDITTRGTAAGSSEYPMRFELQLEYTRMVYSAVVGLCGLHLSSAEVAWLRSGQSRTKEQ